MERIEQLVDVGDDDENASVSWFKITRMLLCVDEPHKRSVKGKAENFERDFEGWHKRLFMEYFWPTHLQGPMSMKIGPVYSEELLKRRFRMPRNIFDTLYSGARSHNTYLWKGEAADCTGKRGASALLKETAALRQLAYGICGDEVDEYCRLSSTTVLLSLKEFCRVIAPRFEAQYLRASNTAEMKSIEAKF